MPGRLRRASRAGSLVSSGARSPQRAFGTYGTFVPFSKGCAQVVYREKSGLAAGDPARGRDGELMRKTLLLAGILIFAGTARAQMGGSINNLGSISGGGSLNGVVGLNAGAVTSSVIAADAGSILALGYLHRTCWTPGDGVTVAGRRAIIHELPWD